MDHRDDRVFVLGIYGSYQNHLFAVDAQQTIGKVETKIVQTQSVTRGLRYTRYLSYSYYVNGVPYSSAKILVTNDTWFAVEVHDDIRISYLPHEPSHSRINLPAENRANQLRPAVALILGIVCLFPIPSYCRSKNRRRL